MGKHVTPRDDNIKNAPLAEALGERYLAYALSTIMHRALPDVRDGLKPVHRRLLHAMRQLGLDSRSGFKKCARVVGDVIGKFHPHGDQAVYDALVRLAQDYAQRYPLIEGQGNFGNVDGDNAAAMRYTESRLTQAAELLLSGLDDDTVDFRTTYDGGDKEPVVLPAGFPNLLANGTSGIAVGMATSIPPHNIAELCDALLHLIKVPDARDSTLLQFVKGPDFPTGGVIVESRESMAEAYKSGRGGFRLRARWKREDTGRGTWQAVVTEIPYQVQKSKLVERIAVLMQEKKLPFLDGVHDESAEDMRLVLVPKSRAIEPATMMEQLFRLTELEVRFPLNMNVLDGGTTPCVMSLKQALKAYLDHRKEVLGRRSRFRLKQIETRLEILDGYLVVYLDLDKVIRIVRNEDEPKPKLMKAFRLSEAQADAILNMRLRALRKLEEMEIKAEHSKLKDEAAALRKLLKSNDLQWKAIADEVRALKEMFGAKTPLGRRRTAFADAPAVEDVPPEAFVEREPITIVCSAKGWIRALKGHREPGEDIAYKEGDSGKFWVKAETTDKLLLFGSNGRFYTLECAKLPGGRGMGEPVRLMIDLAENEDIAALFVHKPGRELLVASSAGRGFRVKEDDVLASTRKGKQVMNPGEGARAVVAVPAEGDMLATAGSNRKVLIFPLAGVPQLAKGRGVILQRYKDGQLVDAKVFTLSEGLTDANNRLWSKQELSDWRGGRGNAGRIAPKGFPKSNRLNPSPASG